MPEPQKPADGQPGDPDPKTVAEAGTPNPEPKKLDLTQEQLDKIIADRVKRAVPEDYEELKKLKEAQDAADEDKKDELQKAKDAAAEARANERKAIARADARLVKAAILSEAAQAGAHDPDLVVMALTGSDEISVDKDGDVVGAKEAVTALLASKPFLVKGKSGTSGGEFGGNDGKPTSEKIAELERKGDRDSLAEARRLKLAQGLMNG